MRILPFLVFTLYSNLLFAQTANEFNIKSTAAYEENDYELTIHLAEKALEQIGDVTRGSRKDYLTALRNLGYSEMSLGNYNRSLKHFRDFHFISLQKRKNSIEYLESFHSMAKIYNALNRVDSAEFYYNMGIEEISKVIKRNNRFYRRNRLAYYENLVELKAVYATLSDQKGLTSEAISTIEPLIAEIENLFPHEYRSLYYYITLLNNLGSYYMELGDFSKAKYYFNKHSSVVNPEAHPVDFLLSLSNQGVVFSKLGYPDSAINLFQKGREWGEANNLQTRNEFKSLVANLGNEYLNLENYELAIQYLEQSFQLQRQQSSYNSYVYKVTLFNLATAYNWKGDYDKATEIFRQLFHKISTDIQYNFTFLTESEKSAFFKTQQFYFESFTNYCFEASGFLPSIQYSSEPYSDFSLSKDLYNSRLLTKGLILSATSKMRYRLLNSSNEQEKALYQEWVNKKYSFKNLISGNEVAPELIEAAEQELAEAELTLAETSESFRKGFLMPDILWSDIQKRLEPGEAAIEIIRMVNGVGYTVLILTSETVDMPAISFVLSKKGKFMEKEMFSYYKNSIKYQLKDTLSYNNYWLPIIDALKKQVGATELKKISISADGIYHQINLNTLLNPETGRYLIDELEINMVESTRQLVKSEAVPSHEKKALLIGDPAFTLNSENANEIYLPLKGTEKEVDMISEQLQQRKWTVEVNKDKNASKQVLKSVSSPAVVHIATHGFFLNLETEPGENALLTLLLNSGLALTGVNQKDIKTRENGILRAYEATNLNLDSTDLVVLSACETGLGNYYPGEGVYGLQKAFFAAGAKNIIMSLWKVDDEATQKLMTYFYNFWLGGESMQAAFQHSQIELRKSYPKPYYWGAFVLNSN